ncbi:hypothetical protein ACTMU2_23340 [Cupriavidus basilensis]
MAKRLAAAAAISRQSWPTCGGVQFAELPFPAPLAPPSGEHSWVLDDPEDALAVTEAAAAPGRRAGRWSGPAARRCAWCRPICRSSARDR